jgi:hypothetical protein
MGLEGHLVIVERGQAGQVGRVGQVGRTGRWVGQAGGFTRAYLP